MVKTEKTQLNAKLFVIILLGLSLGLSWLVPGSFTATSKAAGPTANNSVPPLNDTFRFGTNMGWRNSSWSDAQYSDLVANLGMNSIRVSLPENYLQTWGYNVALPNMQHYQANNLKNLTAFLGTPTRTHSTAPASAADWQLDYYAPTNLYEPIWNGDGSVNANNYWANYVYRTVSTYKPFVKVWEVWNEPDFTGNWNATQTSWWNSAPNPTDLSHWNNSIYSYVRLLRISYEVIKKVDPQALVATGGLGYESFLDSILRYTDNPSGGVANSSYPLAGGAYFDVLSYHYYPQYAALDLSNNQWNTKSDSDNAVDKLLTLKKNYQGRLLARGYNGTTYPQKYFVVTETGFSSKPGSDNIGSMDLLADYVMKLQVLARMNGVSQVHTYMLSDQEPDSAMTDSYNHMGMYYDIAGLASPANASRKQASYGVETVARSLEGATYDAAVTTSLGLPANARGAVFRNAANQTITVLWARTNGNSENASASVTLSASGSLSLRDWQWSQTKNAQTLTPVNGKIQLNLSGKPVILVGGTGSTSNPTPTAAPVPTSTPAPTVPPNTGQGQGLAVAALSASGSDQNSPVANLRDNNTSSIWGVSGVASAWVKFDLGTDRQVNGLKYFVYGTGHAPSTTIEYSVDGQNWKTFQNGSNINTGSKWGWNTLNLGQAPARYVRVTLVKTDSSLWTLGYYSELQVLGN